MAKTGKFTHSEKNANLISVSNAYSTVNKHTFTIPLDPWYEGVFNGYLESLLFTLSDIAGGASKITIRLCADANGDVGIVGDVELAFDIGITTATVGSGQILYDHFQCKQLSGTNQIFVFYKLDAGTAKVTQCQLNWSE